MIFNCLQCIIVFNLIDINNFSSFSLGSLCQTQMYNLDTFGNNPETQEYSSQNPLAPVYKKVNELNQAIKMREAEKQQKIFIKHFAQVPKNNLKLGIDRVDQFIQKRIDGFTTRESFGMMQTKTTFKKTRDHHFQEIKQSNFPKISMKKRSKSEKVIKFLKNHRDKIPVHIQEQPKTPELHEPQEIQQRQIFTPMRPISKISGHPESVSGFSGTEKSLRSRSQNRSSISYSQTARLTHISSKSSTPGQYLRKGHRVRETLKRQFQNPSGIEQQGQMAYLREYDQWVPAAFVNYKKMELDHFMNIMFGAKKVQQKASHVFEPIYL